MRLWRLVLAFLLTLSLSAFGETRREVPLKLGSWVTLEVSEPPVTLHRWILDKHPGPVPQKDWYFDPSYHQLLFFQVEFSNPTGQDYNLHYLVELVDGKGAVIDGFKGVLELDDGKVHALVHAVFPTSRYGLTHARKVRVRFTVVPD